MGILRMDSLEGYFFFLESYFWVWPGYGVDSRTSTEVKPLTPNFVECSC